MEAMRNRGPKLHFSSPYTLLLRQLGSLCVCKGLQKMRISKENKCMLNKQVLKTEFSLCLS